MLLSTNLSDIIIVFNRLLADLNYSIKYISPPPMIVILVLPIRL